jgi:hypothetical protein
MSEATQEQSGVKQDCLCVQHMNDALRNTYPGVKLLIDLISGKPVVAAVRISGKGKTPTIFANFCPFCGIKYED